MAVGNSHEENALTIALPSNSIMRSETPSSPLHDSSTGTQRPASVLGVGIGGAGDTFVSTGTAATAVSASLTSTFVSSLLGALQATSANIDPAANTATHLFTFIPVLLHYLIWIESYRGRDDSQPQPQNCLMMAFRCGKSLGNWVYHSLPFSE
jgi:hypothetical protein